MEPGRISYNENYELIWKIVLFLLNGTKFLVHFSLCHFESTSSSLVKMSNVVVPCNYSDAWFFFIPACFWCFFHAIMSILILPYITQYLRLLKILKVVRNNCFGDPFFPFLYELTSNQTFILILRNLIWIQRVAKKCRGAAGNFVLVTLTSYEGRSYKNRNILQ